MNTTSNIQKIGFASLVMILMLNACAHSPAHKDLDDVQKIISKANAGFYLDQRIWFQDIQAEMHGQDIVLTGEAFFEIPVRSIAKRLRKAGYEQNVIDSVHYLPETFDNNLAYGIITQPYVMGRYKPVDVKQEGTEMLYGEPVRLIRELEQYLQVQSQVGYLGYIPKDAVRRVTLSEWNQYQAGKQASFSKSVRLENGFVINMGTRLPYLGGDSLLLADGSIIDLDSEHYKVVDPAANPLRQNIIAAAEEFLGLPYVWGGRSADGVDCSGFVMQAYGLNSIYLPRDTDEMANIGKIIGLPGWTDAMLPGDLLFFTGSRRLVTHTAIYLGDGKVIHSLGKGVQIESMNPDDPDYAERMTKRFIFAKRIFD